MEPRSRLAAAIAGTAASTTPAAPSRLQAALAGVPPYKPVQVPVNGVLLNAVMTVIGSERSLTLEAESAESTRARGFEQNLLTQGKYELELAWNTLAEAVLDSVENPVPLGTAELWGKLPPEVIGGLWVQYGEFRAAQDPELADLTKDQVAQIADFVAKKNEAGLWFFGAKRLSRYLLITADQPASSSTERSWPGRSSPAT
jgi:hypothetical protein